MPKHKDELRSHCPINFGLEAFGDRWALLILRDIVFRGKRSYGEFHESEEGFATNILASRLAHFVDVGILERENDEADGRRTIYTLTQKGLDLVPVLFEMVLWSAKYDRDSEAKQIPRLVELIRQDNRAISRKAIEQVRRGEGIVSDYSSHGSLQVGRPAAGGAWPPHSEGKNGAAEHPSTHESDAPWMRHCEELARQAAAVGNTPVGAVVVMDGAAIGEAAEEAPRGQRPFAHAELLAVEAALRTAGHRVLEHATLYSTAEPCILCGFAIREAHIARVVVGRPSGDIGSIRSGFPVLGADWVDRWGPPPEVVWWREPS